MYHKEKKDSNNLIISETNTFSETELININNQITQFLKPDVWNENNLFSSIGFGQDKMSYRGFDITFDVDEYGQQMYTTFQNEVISFGMYNTSYKDIMKSIIDQHLDLIILYDIPGAKLTYFQNGSFRDIALYYKDRLLKVWLLGSKELSQDALDKIKKKGLEIVTKVQELYRISKRGD